MKGPQILSAQVPIFFKSLCNKIVILRMGAVVELQWPQGWRNV